MDSGPFRAPRSAETDRRAVSRQEPAQRAEPQPIATSEEPKPVHRDRVAAASYAPPEKKSLKKLFLLPIILILVVAIVAISGWSLLANKQTAVAPIDSGKYQAVFSTSGLVYFGKLESLNSDYFKLSKAYYLQSPTTGTASTTDEESNDQKLIKLSDAIHGPEDEMIIPKAQVLFYENLKTDSKVAQAIAKDNP